MLSFQDQVAASIAAVQPQVQAIKAITKQFPGALVIAARETNKSLVVSCESRVQAATLAAFLNAGGWSVQIQKGLVSEQFYALVYFNFPY